MPFFSFAAPSGKYAVGQEDAMWVDRWVDRTVHVGTCGTRLCMLVPVQDLPSALLSDACVCVCLWCVYESFVQSQGKKLVVRLFYPCDASEAKICRY